MNSFNDEICEYNYSDSVTENFDNSQDKECVDKCNYESMNALVNCKKNCSNGDFICDTGCRVNYNIIKDDCLKNCK
jgi:hypothetical protein